MMGSRLGHKKSRGGCQFCKSRKVKCDETTPACCNCLRHGLRCLYNRPKTNGWLKDGPSTSKKISLNQSQSKRGSLTGPWSTPSCDVVLAETEHRRLLEIRLFHHFHTTCGPHLSSLHPDLRDMWMLEVPSLAIEHPFLLQAMVAIAALHLLKEPDAGNSHSPTQSSEGSHFRCLNRQQNIDYAEIYQKYLSLALQNQRRAIDNLSVKNADAVCLAASLLTHYTILNDDQRDNERYALPVRWLTIRSSLPAVVRASKRFLRPHAVMWKIIGAHPPLGNSPSANSEYPRRWFDMLLDWDCHPEPGLDPQLRSAYKDTVEYIFKICVSSASGEPSHQLYTRVMGFGQSIPPRLVDLVRQERPRALIILAYFFATTVSVDHVWLLHGAARTHVFGICSILPEEWQWAMEWPLGVVDSMSL